MDINPKNSPMPIPLARLHIGDHIAQYMLAPDGRAILYVSKSAVDDGSLVLLADLPQVLGLAPGKT